MERRSWGGAASICRSRIASSSTTRSSALRKRWRRKSSAASSNSSSDGIQVGTSAPPSRALPAIRRVPHKEFNFEAVLQHGYDSSRSNSKDAERKSTIHLDLMSADPHPTRDRLP